MISSSARRRISVRPRSAAGKLSGGTMRRAWPAIGPPSFWIPAGGVRMGSTALSRREAGPSRHCGRSLESHSNDLSAVQAILLAPPATSLNFYSASKSYPGALPQMLCYFQRLLEQF